MCVKYTRNRCILVTSDNIPSLKDNFNYDYTGICGIELKDYNYKFFSVFLSTVFYKYLFVDYIQIEFPDEDNYKRLGYETLSDAHEAAIKEEDDINIRLDCLRKTENYTELKKEA